MKRATLRMTDDTPWSNVKISITEGNVAHLYIFMTTEIIPEAIRQFWLIEVKATDAVEITTATGTYALDRNEWKPIYDCLWQWLSNYIESES